MTTKLHLGCGKRNIPGFVHVDAVDCPHLDHVAAIDNLTFLQDDSATPIYTCHILMFQAWYEKAAQSPTLERQERLPVSARPDVVYACPVAST